MNKLIIDSVDELSDLIITEDTKLIINLKDAFGTIHIDVMENMCLYVLEFLDNTKNKVEYNIRENGRVIINKIAVNTSDTMEVNLNGYGASIVYNSSLLNQDNNTYSQVINHNYSNTTSHVSNHAINIGDNHLTFDIDAKVYNDSDNCIANQDNKIINMGNGQNEIKPNLIVDNHLIEANHSAYVGSFDKDIIFYLQTRAISKEVINELLVVGFLLEKMELQEEEREKVTLFIKNYI